MAAPARRATTSPPLAPSHRPVNPVTASTAHPIVQTEAVTQGQAPWAPTAPVSAAPIVPANAAPAPASAIPEPPAVVPAVAVAPVVAPKWPRGLDASTPPLSFWSSAAATTAAQLAFEGLLDRARKNRDNSARLMSFQYTLWAVVALIVFVTVVGVILLYQATTKQRARTTAPAHIGYKHQQVGNWTPDDSFREALVPSTVPTNDTEPSGAPLVEDVTDDADAGVSDPGTVRDRISDEATDGIPYEATDEISDETTSDQH
ncbi:hypothetical protein IscW_ISCW002669 [Ixodes scapularis]|uniref:Transmembrane protein n=1 Tax=Ixodes scapularis TaxID=6945 RepID=B7PDR8_IXOSC|nr:hypothetical protein IscW_ISCW002669 [Ixodes scapularis]|eukprot:XP_002411020.1 hypothetical protein IscW_ISCW002669 [Ixodes scapularis]